MQDKVEGELERLQGWSLGDLRKLLEGLEAMIQILSEPCNSFQAFRGVGHGMWDDVGGVDEFIKQERASWRDERYE